MSATRPARRPDAATTTATPDVADTHRKVFDDFTLEELAALQHWCLKYRTLVRSGGTPTSEQDVKFRAFSRITYAAGVHYVEP